MKIVFVTIHLEKSSQSVPLAAALLEEYIKAPTGISAHEVISLEFYQNTDPESWGDTILENRPDVIGFSTYLWNREQVTALSRIIGKEYPEIVLIAGGPEVTAHPESVLRDGNFDLVISGEGEIPFSRVIEALQKQQSFENIPGVTTEKNNNLSQEVVQNLDEIPSPFLNNTIKTANYDGQLWELSRGCPFKCAFCYESKGTAGIRKFSLQRIESELHFFEAARISQVFVLDPTFNYDKKRAKKILQMIQETAPSIYFYFEARSEFIDRELAQLFAGITCSLQIGLQSSHNDVLQNLNRKIDRHDFVEKIGYLNEYGVVFGLDLIYGLPGDTLKGFKESINFALSLLPNHLDIFPLAVLPGTQLGDKANLDAETAGGLSLNYHHQPPYTVISTPDFSETNMAEAKKLASACDLFYSKGKAVPWFIPVTDAMGLSPVELLEAFYNYLEIDSSINTYLKNYIIEEKGSFSTNNGDFVNKLQIDDPNLIEKLQLDFVKWMFLEHEQEYFVSLAEDLITYNHAYSRVLLSGDFLAQVPQEVDNLLETTFCLAPSAELFELHYDVYDLLEAGMPVFGEFIGLYFQTGSFVLLFNSPDGVETVSLYEPCYRVLQKLEGKQSLETILQAENIDPEEVMEFIESATEMGIITPIRNG